MRDTLAPVPVNVRYFIRVLPRCCLTVSALTCPRASPRAAGRSPAFPARAGALSGGGTLGPEVMGSVARLGRQRRQAAGGQVGVQLVGADDAGDDGGGLGPGEDELHGGCGE